MVSDAVRITRTAMSLDEDLLLNAALEEEHIDDDVDIDEDVLLGIDNNKSPNESNDNAPNEQEHDAPSETQKAAESGNEEELDYDDDEDEEERRERTSRYSSERRKENVCNDIKQKNSSNNNNNNGNSKPDGIPSLLDKSISKPTHLKKTKTLSNQPIAVKLKLDGGPTQLFLPNQQHQSYAFPGAIVPRLPNGVPLVPTSHQLPPNHGSAGFGPTYYQQPNYQQRMAGGGGAPPAAQWDQAVDMFLSGTLQRKRTRRRSGSHSSESSYSTESSRSRSRSPHRRRGERRRRGDDRKRRHDDKKRSRDDYKKKEQYRNTTIESAKALGLDSEYLDKVNEQKRKREEIIRRKEERRYGSEKASATRDRNHSSSSAANGSSDREKKVKAYLAVNVANLRQLPTAVKRVESMATELGPIRKCWRSTDDVVSIIFQAHDKAKEFMLKYNNQIMSGLRIAVSLEKKYLNLSDIE